MWPGFSCFFVPNILKQFAQENTGCQTVFCTVKPSHNQGFLDFESWFNWMEKWGEPTFFLDGIIFVSKCIIQDLKIIESIKNLFMSRSSQDRLLDKNPQMLDQDNHIFLVCQPVLNSSMNFKIDFSNILHWYSIGSRWVQES